MAIQIVGSDTRTGSGGVHSSTEPVPDPWPVGGLTLHTPRLELRPDDDAGLRELAALALQGVHPPGAG